MQDQPVSPQTKIQELAWYRMYQIIGCKRRGIPPLLPISRTTFINRVNDGIYPKPARIGVRQIAWCMADVKKMLTKMEGGL